MQLRLQGQTRRSRRLCRRPHNGPRAALPSPSSPSSAPEPSGPAVCRRGGASRSSGQLCRSREGDSEHAAAHAAVRSCSGGARSSDSHSPAASPAKGWDRFLPGSSSARAATYAGPNLLAGPHACASCMQSEPRTSGAGAGRAGALTLSLGARCFPSRRSCSIGGPQPSTAASPNGGPTPRPAGLEI